VNETGLGGRRVFIGKLGQGAARMQPSHWSANERAEPSRLSANERPELSHWSANERAEYQNKTGTGCNSLVSRKILFLITFPVGATKSTTKIISLKSYPSLNC
jgi:hypothetical protein